MTEGWDSTPLSRAEGEGAPLNPPATLWQGLGLRTGLPLTGAAANTVYRLVKNLAGRAFQPAS